MSKKTTKWSKGLENSLDYILDIYETEMRKTETKTETTERLGRMAETADKCIQLIKQCPECKKYSDEKNTCFFYEKLDYPCIDFVRKVTQEKKQQ